MSDPDAALPHPSELVGAYPKRTKKRFGQHFLADVSVLDRIVDACGVGPGQPVLEVGPGCGSLTTRLLAAGAHVTAVELDRDAAAYLRKAFNDVPNLTLIEGDALKLELSDVVPEGARVAANLPYNVGTQILFRLLESRAFGPMALMFQKEVANRLVAEPRTKAYGALTLQVGAYAQTALAFHVKAGAFRPPPKVDSAVVTVTPRDLPQLASEQVEARFRDLVVAGFAVRRKMLRNALGRRFESSDVVQWIQSAGVVATARAEELSLDDFARLASASLAEQKTDGDDAEE